MLQKDIATKQPELPFLHIVMKVALFYTKNRSESTYVVTFCIILFHLLGDDCQSIPIFLL
jgi:hypothetical protein